MSIKRAILQRDGLGLINSDRAAEQLHRLAQTSLLARAAGDAFFTIKYVTAACVHALRARRTHARTFAAADALVRVTGCLRAGADALGIVAPDAAQRAALEKQRRAYARAVVDGEALYVHQQAGGQRVVHVDSLLWRCCEFFRRAGCGHLPSGRRLECAGIGRCGPGSVRSVTVLFRETRRLSDSQ